MRRLILAGALAAGSLLAATAPASAGCGNTTDIGGVVYVNDSPLMWVYVESNGEPGLQQGGSSLLLGESAPCSDEGAPDTLII